MICADRSVDVTRAEGHAPFAAAAFVPSAVVSALSRVEVQSGLCLRRARREAVRSVGSSSIALWSAKSPVVHITLCSPCSSVASAHRANPV